MTKDKNGRYYCDFCRKSQKDVKKLISDMTRAPYPAICNECIEMCLEILIEENMELSTFRLMPKDVVQIMGFHPVFSRRSFAPEGDTCFYLGPFAEPFTTIYKEHIDPIFKKYNFAISRADEIFSTDIVIEDVWAGINSSSIIVADVTGKNPNVLYEVGIAHTVGKPVLMISQSADDIPFDLRHRRCVIYEYTPPGCRKLEDGIRQTIQYFRQGTEKHSS
jgi:ClpX C4-type zinc finger